MTESKDKLPENEVDDSHDSIEVTDLTKWITPQPKPTTDEEQEEQNHSYSIVEVELSSEQTGSPRRVETTVETYSREDGCRVCKEWFAGLQSI